MLRIIVGNFSVRFFSALANLLIAILISQYLGADGKGEQSIILATITFILLVSNLIGGASIVYLTPRLGLKSVLFTSYSWTFFVSLCCYLFLSFVPGFSMKFNLSISILSGINSIAAINSVILIGKEKIPKSNLINFFIPFLTLISIAIQFYLEKNNSISSYIIALYVAYFSAALISLYFVMNEISDEDKFSLNDVIPTYKSLFYYGFQNQLAHIFQLLSFRLSYFLLDAHSGGKSVGIYSNGLSIVESIWMITSSISLYQYARISNSNDRQFAMKLTEKLTKLGLFLAFIALLIILFIPSSFFVWLFGKEFSEVNSIIRLMAPGIFIYNYSLIMGHYFSGFGKYYVGAIASFIGFVVTAILTFIFFNKLDIYIVSIIADFSYISTALVVIFFYLKEGGRFVVFPRIHELRLFISQYKKSNCQ
jgi:O-antigen/teichoic acid export membrane protein